MNYLLTESVVTIIPENISLLYILPKSLKILYCYELDIIELPELPPTLEELYIYLEQKFPFNKFYLPKSLKHLQSRYD